MDLVVNAPLATTSRSMTTGRIDVVTGSVAPVTGTGAYARTPARATVTMSDRVSLQPDETENAAAEYYIPDDLTTVLDLVRAHGIQLRQLTQSTRAVEQFVATGPIDAGMVDGHAMRRLAGTWQPAPGVVVPIGTWVVRMNQRLSRLAFSLLEPASSDGLVAWNVIDPSTLKTYPILRKR
jgi:hypothetical protein